MFEKKEKQTSLFAVFCTSLFAIFCAL